MRVKNTSTIFPKRLKQLRLAEALTQIKLANELNISRSCLANYERGKRFPDAHILSIIADFFKVNVDYLLVENPLESAKSPQHNVTDLLKEVASNGKLDISGISPISKIALFEFYKFLDERENKLEKIESI